MKKVLLNSLFSLLLFFCSCATSSHKVNFKKIQENKNKTFKLNMVKVAGCKGSYRDDYIKNKKDALEKIPIDKICNTLNSHYGLEIDTNIDKTTQIAYDCVECGFGESSTGGSSHPGTGVHLKINIQPTCQNPYWGYIEPTQGILNRIFKGFEESEISQPSEIIEITYGCGQSDASRLLFDTKLEYQVIIKTKDKILVKHKGIVESFKKQKDMWDNIISCTDKINDALIRDINKTK
ncbi:MAG: hypothetical protein ACMUIU_08280 [bacterium]